MEGRQFLPRSRFWRDAAAAADDDLDELPLRDAERSLDASCALDLGLVTA